MRAKKKLFQSAEALKGIYAHDGFLGEETLSWIAQNDRVSSTLSGTIINDRMRSFRETYREFHQKCDMLLKRNEQKKLQDLYRSWARDLTSYLGYSTFEVKQVDHWEKGSIPYYSPIEDTHSVAVFYAFATSTPISAFEGGSCLSAKDGQVSSESSRRESLSEQIEKSMKLIGQGEAILLLPHAAYYFRSDSQVSGQCLEIRWDELLMEDNDRALGLAIYFLRQEFFAYSQSADSAEEGGEEASESEDGADDESAQGAGGGSLRLTESSNIFKEDLEQSRRITEELHQQVVLALEILINERLHLDSDLQSQGRSKSMNEKVAFDLFKDGLFVLYRILFTLYAESREFLPVHNREFASFYSLEHLRDWSELFLRQRDRGLGNPDGTYIWGALKSIFTLLRRGVSLVGGEQVSPFNGQLFAPERSPLFDNGPALRDEAMAKVLTSLTRVGGDASGRRLHFANLGIEQLGAVYEALLAQKPVIVREPSIWVPAHGGGIGLVTERLADALDMELFVDDQRSARSKRRSRSGGKTLDSFIDPRRPAYHPSVGVFIIAPLGGQRRQTASFYTPPKLAEFLVRRTLRPLVEGKNSKDILKLRIIEPAMGSGGFLIATVRYMADALLKARIRERSIELRDGGKPSIHDFQRCKRDVVEHCIFGVDINPLAIELARTSLYLEALIPGEPLPFLHHRLRSGNSLIGADFQNRAISSWEEGMDFPMIFELPIESLRPSEDLLEAWGNAGVDMAPQNPGEEWAKKISSLKAERKAIGAEAWCDWANARQHDISNLLQLARQAQDYFDKEQNSNSIIDDMDARHQDHLGMIPDMDPVLIEGYGVEVDADLAQKRKKALITEWGEKRYHKMVSCQRAFTHLKALGDLHCALWYWPVNGAAKFPSFKSYQEICEWLLDEDGLRVNKRRKNLSPAALKSLLTGLRVAKSMVYFHWELEFASVFGNLEKGGFDGLVSNPPWKVVGVKDKEIYPNFDPQFLNVKPSEKKQRLMKLYKECPESAVAWFDLFQRASYMTEHWRNGRLSDIPPEGKVDMAVLFTLRSERLVRESGCSGLIVSRSSIFVNKASRNLRERFFKEWGLKEACSFTNTLKIFEIDSRVDFVLLIGQHGQGVSSPKFIHNLIDPNSLERVSINLDQSKPLSVTSGAKPVELNVEMIQRFFSKENLSIPGITDPRQVIIARALHEASGPVVYLDDLDAIVQQGVNQTTGPKKGYSQFASNISKNEIPKWNDILNGKVCKWVPLYRGRDFDIARPVLVNYPEFNQYATRKYIEELGVDLAKPILAWRDISQASNQRTLISSVLPANFYCNNTVWTLHSDQESVLALATLMASTSLDYLCRLTASSHVNLGIMRGIPFANYKSNYLKRAMEIYVFLFQNCFRHKSKLFSIDPVQGSLADIDALIWLHYVAKNKSISRDSLEWLFSTQFDCLNRNDPEYKFQVLKSYDRLAKEIANPGFAFESVLKTKSKSDVIELSSKKKARKSAS